MSQKLLALAVALGALAACQDPVHDQQVAALGGEAPGVPQGQNHRPGQPCLVCHGGQGPASLSFAIAGTVFQKQDDPSQGPANNVTVDLEDVTGSKYQSTTNSAGNFFIVAGAWTPTFPITVPCIYTGAQCILTGPMQSQSMVTLDNRSGSCATCHTLQVGPESNGPVYLNH